MSYRLKIQRPALTILLHTVFVALGVQAATHAAAPASPPPPAQTWQVKGLRQNAQIILDTWGVPHIYAQNQDDVFFAQGFNAARDRLFQIDLWRRRGLGQLAAVFGDSFVAQDQATRLFLYRGDMQKEWRAYGKGAANISQRFVAGINAYVDYVSTHPENLPFEFKALNYLPAKWQPEDVVRIRSHGLTRNLTSEVARAQNACSGNLAADHIRMGLQPKWETKLPAGLDPCLPADVLRVFTLATQNVVFDPATLKPTSKLSQSDGTPGQIAPLTTSVAPTLSRNPQPDPETMEGSNNWVIAPKKSATGRPILANDPHRGYAAPSLRYIAHLSAPGLDVIGAGEPALPGISIGHNGTIAFGLTIFGMDQEDLYVYELNPAKPMQYKYRGKWEDIKIIKEKIEVRGGVTREIDLAFTRHGPIIYTESAKQRAFVVRSGWLEAGMAPYFGSVDFMRAKNYPEFKKAMLHWGAPTENQVYADIKGNIAWVPGGLAPIRRNWDGLLPVPGDGRYEWAGFLSGDQLPFALNPEQGWLATANEMNLPANYPYAKKKIGFEWSHDSRMTRISEVLAQPGKVTIEDTMRLQIDQVSVPARRLVTILKTLKAGNAANAAHQTGLSLLKDWDANQTLESSPAALFEVWWSRHLLQAWKDAMLGPLSGNLLVSPDVTVMLNLLENPDARFGADPKAKRDQILLTSLGKAVADMEKLQGPDPKAWRWGKLQVSYFIHPLANLADPATNKQINVGPFPRAGSAYTVNQSSYRQPDFLQSNGPSVRVVLDVGNWDNSRAINTPGQAGDPASPHYRDLAEKWAKGEYFPLLYSREAVQKAARQVFLLQPAK
jgi:penicillin G amidase